MRSLGIFFLLLSVLFLLFGLLLIFLPSLPRVPGDIVIRKKGLVVFIPLGTSIILSLLLTLILNLIFRGK